MNIEKVKQEENNLTDSTRGLIERINQYKKSIESSFVPDDKELIAGIDFFIDIIKTFNFEKYDSDSFDFISTYIYQKINDENFKLQIVNSPFSYGVDGCLFIMFAFFNIGKSNGKIKELSK